MTIPDHPPPTFNSFAFRTPPTEEPSTLQEQTFEALPAATEQTSMASAWSWLSQSLSNGLVMA